MLGLASFAFSWSWLLVNPNPVNDSYGWHMQYLTIIGLALFGLTFAVALLADFTASRTLFRIKNTLGVASAPMEVLISLLYWSLRTVCSAGYPRLWVPSNFEGKGEVCVDIAGRISQWKVDLDFADRTLAD